MLIAAVKPVLHPPSSMTNYMYTDHNNSTWTWTWTLTLNTIQTSLSSKHHPLSSELPNSTHSTPSNQSSSWRDVCICICICMRTTPLNYLQHLSPITPPSQHGNLPSYSLIRFYTQSTKNTNTRKVIDSGLFLPTRRYRYVYNVHVLYRPGSMVLVMVIFNLRILCAWHECVTPPSTACWGDGRYQVSVSVSSSI